MIIGVCVCVCSLIQRDFDATLFSEFSAKKSGSSSGSNSPFSNKYLASNFNNAIHVIYQGVYGCWCRVIEESIYGEIIINMDENDWNKLYIKPGHLFTLQIYSDKYCNDINHYDIGQLKQDNHHIPINQSLTYCISGTSTQVIKSSEDKSSSSSEPSSSMMNEEVFFPPTSKLQILFGIEGFIGVSLNTWVCCIIPGQINKSIIRIHHTGNNVNAASELSGMREGDLIFIPRREVLKPEKTKSNNFTNLLLALQNK